MMVCARSRTLLSAACATTARRTRVAVSAFTTNHEHGVVMRTILTLVAVAALAACSDHQSPTSPKSLKPSLEATSAPSSEATKAPPAGAKPADQVGFTKITKGLGGIAQVDGGFEGSSIAKCPTGTVLTGGGYTFTIGNGVPPFVQKSQDDGANGWLVHVVNTAPGSNVVLVAAFAYCAS